MILQKDLQLFRFKNIRPHKEFSPKKYEYQLFNKRNLLVSQYSDNEFRQGLITIGPEGRARIELINDTDGADRKMEDENTFIVNVKPANN